MQPMVFSLEAIRASWDCDSFELSILQITS